MANLTAATLVERGVQSATNSTHGTRKPEMHPESTIGVGKAAVQQAPRTDPLCSDAIQQA